MELIPGNKYRFWVRGEPLDYVATFEKILLVEQSPPLPRLEPYPPMPIQHVYLIFRYESGGEITIAADEIKGIGVELVQIW